MKESVEGLLHPRILKHCLPRYRDGYYKDAAAEAMTQVERAIKEKAGVTDKFGVNLVTSVFGKGVGIKLRVPLGAHMQEAAQRFLEGAFSYYRNYAHHEGEQIDHRLCMRVMIIASDILDLVGVAALSFEDIGGVQGLVSKGIFPSAKIVVELLGILDENVLPDEVCDGFYDDLYKKGFNDKQLQAVVDLGLVEYRVEEPVFDPRMADDTETLGIFVLTSLGKTARDDLASMA